MSTHLSNPRGSCRSAFAAALLALGALLALAPAGASAAPASFWQRCQGGEDDVACGITRGVAADPNAPGHVYVADQSNKSIVEFSAWGEFLKTWGWDVTASGPGENGTGFEICVPANGDICKVGVSGVGAGQLGSPQGVAVDSAGSVYVVDRPNQRVQKFSSSGQFLRMWGKGVNSGTSGNPDLCTNAGPPTDVCGAGSVGSENGQFGEWVVLGSYVGVDAKGTATDADDRVYVGEAGRIQYFDTAGAYQGQINLGVGEKVKSLAVDPKTGHLYAAIENQGDVRKWTAAGVVQPSVKVTAPIALAVDAARNLYVLSGSANALIRKFNVVGGEVESWGQEEPPVPKLGAPTGLGAGSACLEKGADVYVSSGTASPAFVRAYGAAPNLLAQCPRPARPPSIAAQYALSAGTVEATVRAEINPRFWGDATYYVQYGTAACLGGGWEASCVEEQPAPPGLKLEPNLDPDDLDPNDIGAGAAVRSAGVLLAGLSPETAYRFRFVAQSGGGGPVAGVGGEVGADGADGSFRTFALPAPLPACANDPFRLGAGAFLPDCRAYEMVSPLDKGGGDVLAFENSTHRSTALQQSSLSGDRLAYSSFRAFGDSATQPYTAQYIASRDPAGGWSSHGISPPRGVANGSPVIQSENEFKAFSADLCEAWLASVNQAIPPLLTADTVEGTYNLYRRSNCGAEGYEALGAGATGSGTALELQGVSGDGSRAIFRARDHLTQEGARPVGSTLACQTATAAKTTSFQWLRDGEPVAGKTAAQYVAGAADAGKTVQCQATASNENAGATQIANPAWVIAPYPASEPPEAPASIAAPGASAPLEVGGAGGQILSCDPNAAGWEGSPGFEYRWYRNGVTVAGASEPTYTVQPADLASPATFQCGVIGANAGGRVAKASENALSSPAPSEPAAPRGSASMAGSGFDTFLYEAREGELHSVCLVAGQRTEVACSAGTASGPNDGRSSSVAGAISADGERVFWSSATISPGKVHVRVGGTQTIELSSAAAQFWGAAADGSAAVLSEGADLYRVDVDKALAAEAGAKELIAGQAMGVVGMSEEAGRIYFVSKEALGGGGAAGQPNLYLHEAGGGYDFVATLSAADARVNTGGENEPSPVNVEPFKHSARVTADGGAAAFMSSAPLGGYDNTDLGSGKADAEVYRYEAGSGELQCVSCNPSGARPAGRNVGTGSFPFWAAAWIPGSTTQLYAPRALSADGDRLFFNSFEALVAADTNANKQDAYQWEATGAGTCTTASPAYSPPAGGCLSLLSSGDSPLDSEFLDASPTGDDVFIRTGSSLIGSDPGQIDIYDARVGGGFPEPAAEPPCEGEACQSPAPAPEPLRPASSAFSGPGNAAAPPRGRRCAKGKRRVRRGGRTRCVKKQRQHKRKREGRRGHGDQRRAGR